MDKVPEQTLLQGGHTDGPEIYEMMLSIIRHQRDANENHIEIPLHTIWNGYHKEINKKQVLARLWRQRNPNKQLVEMQTGAPTLKNSMEFPQKTTQH